MDRRGPHVVSRSVAYDWAQHSGWNNGGQKVRRYSCRALKIRAVFMLVSSTAIALFYSLRWRRRSGWYSSLRLPAFWLSVHTPSFQVRSRCLSACRLWYTSCQLPDGASSSCCVAVYLTRDDRSLAAYIMTSMLPFCRYIPTVPINTYVLNGLKFE